MTNSFEQIDATKLTQDEWWRAHWRELSLLAQPEDYDIRPGTDAEVQELFKECELVKVPELAALEDSTQFVFVHTFDSLGFHCSTWFFRADECLLRLLSLRFAKVGKQRLGGFVIGYETKKEHFKSLPCEVATVDIPLNRLKYSEISNEEMIGRAHGVLLQRLKMRNGETIWEVLPIPGVFPDLTVLEQCYVWVFKNGMAAKTRWENLNTRHGETS